MAEKGESPITKGPQILNYNKALKALNTKAEKTAKEMINRYDRTGDRRMDIHKFIGACNRDPGILKILKVFGEMVH